MVDPAYWIDISDLSLQSSSTGFNPAEQAQYTVLHTYCAD